MLNPVIIQLLLILVKIVCLLITIAYYTIAERKIMAAIQRRRGPNVVGFWGLLQPLADGLKLIAKEMVIPSHSNSRIFVVAPLAILTLGLLNWSILPFGCFDYSENSSTNEIVKTLYVNNASSSASKAWINNSFELLTEINYISDVRYGVLVILALSSLTVYGLIIAGWASNSKYAFLGALRSAAQMISYEVSISLVLIPVIFMSGSLNFTEIVFAQGQTTWFVLPLLPISIIFFISMIAETNRTPFDLPEAEAELVAGYNVEYSSIIFAMFFLAEYSNMIMMSLINSELFFGGWYGLPFIPLATTVTLKALIFCFLFVLVRATFPRYRYDQLMDIGWKVFLPVATGFLLFVIGLIVVLDATPVVSSLSQFDVGNACIFLAIFSKAKACHLYQGIIKYWKKYRKWWAVSEHVLLTGVLVNKYILLQFCQTWNLEYYGWEIPHCIVLVLLTLLYSCASVPLWVFTHIPGEIIRAIVTALLPKWLTKEETPRYQPTRLRLFHHEEAVWEVIVCYLVLPFVAYYACALTYELFYFEYCNKLLLKDVIFEWGKLTVHVNYAEYQTAVAAVNEELEKIHNAHRTIPLENLKKHADTLIDTLQHNDMRTYNAKLQEIGNLEYRATFKK